MKKLVLVLLLLFVFAISSKAISSNEAVNFVVNENSYLLEGETFKSPVVTIKGEKENYWLVMVLSEETIVTFFPVRQRAKEISTSRGVNRNLFKTADILRELGLEKQRVSENQSVDWLFTQTYNILFNSLSLELNNEIFQLNTIESTLSDSTIRSKINQLNNDLQEMSNKSNEISFLIIEAVKTESNFNLEPSTKKADELKEKFDEVFEDLTQLNEKALSYRTEINQLKELISKSDQDASTKTYLIALADPPPQFNSIGNYVLDASEISGGIDSVYARVDLRTDSLLNEFDVRIARNKAFELLYEQSDNVLASTNQEYGSIRELIDYILNEQNRPFWKLKSNIHLVESNWNQAQKAFNERNYESAESIGKKALNEALKVFRQGFIDVTPQKPFISEETIFQIVTALVVLLVVLFAYNNRDKITGYIKQDSEKEVDFGDY